MHNALFWLQFKFFSLTTVVVLYFTDSVESHCVFFFEKAGGTATIMNVFSLLGFEPLDVEYYNGLIKS